MANFFGTDKINIIFGTEYPDNIYGRGENDYLYGGLGADIIAGGRGSDIVDGGSGFDIVFGGAGDDDLVGGGNRSHLYGGTGNDYLAVGGRSKDGPSVVFGGEGKDEFLFIPAYLEKTVKVHLHDYEVGETIKLGVNYETLADGGVSPDDVRVRELKDKLVFAYSDDFGDHKLVVQGVGKDLINEYGSVQAMFDADALAFQWVGY